MLDNPMRSVKVAQRHEERNYRVEIVPNPFGGVNTHLWRNEAYIVGIVPHSSFLYSIRERQDVQMNPEAVWCCQRKEQGRCLFPRNLNSALALGLLHLSIS